ncbi:MAG: BON domain-containing protein [Nitrospirales bacterium]|nr:BON domain-containing protein [Nitrospirales bacterium]
MAAIGCPSGPVAFAGEKVSHATPPAERVLDHAQRDERVKYTVGERMRMDGRINWEILDVEVSQGHVTLYGEVETKAEKDFSTDITSTFLGVVEITNRIILPGDDVGACKNLQRGLHLAKPLDYASTHRTLERWPPYGGLIYFHLLLNGLDEAGLLMAETFHPQTDAATTPIQRVYRNSCR